MNKFGRIQPYQVQPREPDRPVLERLDGGFRGDVSPRVAPPHCSPNLDAVRFEQGALRKDFGYVGIGTAAPSRILALAEHKFIDGGKSYQRLIRIYRDPSGHAVLSVWTGTAWTVVGVSTETIRDVYLSTASIQGKFVFSDGEKILYWGEQSEVVTWEADFPNGEVIGAIGETTQVAVTAAVKGYSDYMLNYLVDISGASVGGVDLVIEIYHNDTLLTTRLYQHPASAKVTQTQWLNETYIANVDAEDGDLFKIKVADLSYIGISDVVHHFFLPVGTETAIGVLPVPANDRYNFSFNYTISGPTYHHGEIYPSVMGVRLEVDLLGNGNWVTLKDVQISGKLSGDSSGTYSDHFILSGVTAVTRFRVNEYTVGETGAGSISSDVDISWVKAGSAPPVIMVRGKNKATTGDADAGLVWHTLGFAISVFELISADAPGARIVAPFADRLIGLRDGGDTQALGWSTSGDIRDWVGTGSGSIVLVNSRMDALDDLMGFAELGSNLGALFRKRSIDRVFPTGNILQAIGVVPWIPGVGTEFPFSIQNGLGGVFFLGHDRMVYRLSETGLSPAGRSIQQELIKQLTDNLENVDSAYDSVFNEYILGIPEAGSRTITKLWILDVDHFNLTGEERWRSRNVNVQRLAAVSTL